MENADGTVQNLTTLDSDLWKTLSNWADFIKTGNKDYLEKHSFVLVTNKNENNNDFIKSLIDFKTNFLQKAFLLNPIRKVQQVIIQRSMKSIICWKDQLTLDIKLRTKDIEHRTKDINLLKNGLDYLKANMELVIKQKTMLMKSMASW